MTYGPGYIGNEAIKLVGYSDSDYANNQFTYTISDFKSITEYVFFLVENLISDQSKR